MLKIQWMKKKVVLGLGLGNMAKKPKCDIQYIFIYLISCPMLSNQTMFILKAMKTNVVKVGYAIHYVQKKGLTSHYVLTL